MVERQYDVMKRERMKQLEEPKIGGHAAAAVRAEDNEMPVVPTQPNTTSAATAAPAAPNSEPQSSEQEVGFSLFKY